MLRQRNAAFIIPAIGILLSCAYLVELSRISNWEARYYPTLICLLALISSVAAAFGEFRSSFDRSNDGEAAKSEFGGAELRAAGSLLLALAVLILGLNFLGTILSAAIFIVTFRTLMKCFHVTTVLVEFLVATALTIGFQRFLHIPLPLGSFDRLVVGLI